jgi:hypothetical protein
VTGSMVDSVESFGLRLRFYYGRSVAVGFGACSAVR